MTGASQSRAAKAVAAKLPAPRPSLEQEPLVETSSLARRVVSAGRTATEVGRAAGGLQGRAEAQGAKVFRSAKLRQRADELDRRVTAAAVELVAAFEALLADTTLWKRLGADVTGWEELSVQQVHEVREVLAHDLPGLLTELGYVPPPAETLWTTWVQDSLDDLVEGRGPEPARAAQTAEWELRCFVIQLRALVAAEDRSVIELAGQDRTRRARIVEALTDGGGRAVVAGMATAAAVMTAALVGPDPTLVGTVAGASASKVAEALVVSFGTRALASGAPAVLAVDDSLRAADEVLRIWLANTDGDEVARRRSMFLVRRGLYAVLASARPATTYDDDELWRLVASTVDACERGLFDREGLRAFREELAHIGLAQD